VEVRSSSVGGQPGVVGRKWRSAEAGARPGAPTRVAHAAAVGAAATV